MRALLILINEVINIYIYMIIATAILSWLISFGVVNRYNRAISTIGDMLIRLTEPVLEPIGRLLIRIGLGFNGIDVSPIVAILLLEFARNLIFEMFSGLTY